MNRILVFFISICLFVSNLYAQVDSEWRGIGRTGFYSNETNLLKQWPESGPELLWYADSLPKGYASVAVAYNTAYLTGTIDTLDVLSAFSMEGKKLWQTTFGRAWDNSYEFNRCTPTIDNKFIYVASGLGDIACIDAMNGSLIWQKRLAKEIKGAPGKFGYAESLLVIDDKVYATPGGELTTMVALDKATGKLVWKSESIDYAASYASPMILQHNQKSMILNLSESYLFALNPNNGELLWKFDYGAYAKSRKNQTNTPLYYNNSIFLTSGYDHKSVMLSLNNDASEVSVKWVDSILDVHHGGVVQVDGYIYGANWLHNRNGNWTCLEWETGQVKYSSEWGNKGSIIAADGMLYCFEEKSGSVGIAPINPDKFEIVSSFKVPYGDDPFWAHLVIDNGKLFVRSSNAIMVYNIKE